MSDKRSSKKSKSNGEALETPTQSSKLNITETSSALSLSSITTISPKSSSATTSVHPLQSTSLDKTPVDPKSTTSSKSSDFSTSTVNPEGQVSYSASSTDSLSNTTLEAQIEKHLEKVDETRKRIKFNTEIHNSGLKRNAHLSKDNASKIIENEFPSDDNEQFNKQFTAIPKHTQLKCSDSRCYERKLGFVPATSGESGDEDENSRRPLHYTVDYHEMNKRFSHGTLAEIYDDEFFSYADRHSDLPNKADLKEGIFCCMITGLVIASLIMTSYFIILLIDPITDSMHILHDLFYNITKLMFGNEKHYHRHLN